jgi:predicted phage terminase large subunit-like protein
MGRPCTICQHPERAEIEAAVTGVGEGAVARVARRFDVGRMALVRHREAGHESAVAKVKPAKKAPALATATSSRPTSPAAPPKRPPPPSSWTEAARDGLMAFIPRLSPEFTEPRHLAQWVELIERAAKGEAVRALCDVPIRHFKSETTEHGIVWLLVQDPTMRVVVMTHSLDKARNMGRRMRALAERAGIGPAYGSNRIDDWTNAAGGGVATMSAAQSKLGGDVHLLLFDDPLNEHTAMVHREREAVDATITHYTARCVRRGKPGPVLGVMSRWHPDDPIGRRLLRKAETWEHVHHPAVIEDGETGVERAFAPEVWSLDQLRQVRAVLREQDPTERLWWAQFQGNPMPVGSTKFRLDPERYQVLPDYSFRLVYGAHLMPDAENFALVALKVFASKAYLIDVVRSRLDATAIEAACRKMIAAHGSAPIFAYTTGQGPDAGLVKILRQRGLNFSPIRARYNKVVRAEKTIRRWNDGDVLVPTKAPWVDGFMHRLALFRGEDKGHDDEEICALVSGSDGSTGVGGVTKALGTSYAGGSGVTGSMSDFTRPPGR